MKRICIVLLALSLGFLTLCQPTFAGTITISPDESLWVHLEAGSTAPLDFDGMTLFWGLTTPWNAGADMDYYIYGPTSYSGGLTTVDPFESPSIVDLSIFEGEDVVFEFRNVSAGTEQISFKKPVAVNDESIPGGESPSKDVYFYYAFYDDATTLGWPNRQAIQYTEGIYSNTAPAHGNPFFFHDLDGTVDGQDPTTINIRSDFQAVPEPATLLLLASGIAVLAGGRKKFKKK